MRTIPHFEPTAYTASALASYDLRRLAKVVDTVGDFAQLAETAERSIKARLAEPGGDTIANRGARLAATSDLNAIRRVRTEVRRTFATRLLAECGTRGFLVDNVVFQAQTDALGFGRIELANPPAPTAEAQP